MNQPTASTMRSRRRRARLDALAKGNGFDTWSQLETAILNGRAILLRPTPKRNPGATTMGAGNG